ncbi:MAG: type I restriction endonuclease subunit R [Flavobacteriales bacterium]|nr:type I restriction endonuclease subunit R [Flavobacteriales bacterium]
MTTQSEAILENNLIQQLVGLGYAPVRINDEAAMLVNLQCQLEAFNGLKFSEREFESILNHLGKGNVFERAKLLRDRFELHTDDEEVRYIRFFNPAEPEKNLFQVTNQITVEGVHKNRYDVTLLVNGLPLVQIELKRRGIELKEAFNQIDRYKQSSFWTDRGLFQFVQLFVISNGVNTKYYANNTIKALTFKQTFFWADVSNRNITDLEPFANSFLKPTFLSTMLSQYIVLNETHKMLMVLRPYQVYAVEAIVKRVKAWEGVSEALEDTGQASADLSNSTLREPQGSVENNGYIWHTTGSGKTLTSFKASQILTKLPEIKKVVFVVDRKDLDFQTMEEFNNFKKGSVDITANTTGLVNQFKDETKLIVTTIQKLNNAISKGHYEKSISHLQNERVVFIFDECHRSQFGDTHRRIAQYFKNHQLFGFTGTPIFADNAMSNELGKRTTKDLFQTCLHKYVITDAIRDQNVLRFHVEYYRTVKRKGEITEDTKVEDIDTKEVLESDERMEKVVDHIIQYHDQKTHNRAYSAMFAVSSIPNLIRYYDIFKAKKEAGQHDLRVATIFSYGANEEDDVDRGALPDDVTMAREAAGEYVSTHSRDKLFAFVDDYNAMFGVKLDMKSDTGYERYFQDLSQRMKNREKANFPDSDRLDILLVVNMFLTGFDAKKLNTLYVDKNLKHHGLIQAYSRTNRILNEQKSQGNILCYRNLKSATDEAIALFSNKEAKEVIFLPEYEKMVEGFSKAFAELLKIAPTVKSVNNLESEEEILQFVQAFRELIRLRNVLKTYTEFTWDDLPMSEQAFADYSSKYQDIRESVKHSKEKVSILNDVDFEVELLHRDEVNVAYILKLLAQQKKTDDKTEKERQKKQILDMLKGEVELRSKRDLIEKFIDEMLPHISDLDSIEDEFKKYWEDQKVLALNDICQEENLDRQQFSNLIETYIFSGQEPLKEQVFACLEQRPSILQARSIGERIIERMKEFVEVFVKGMTA